jgi:hypothetical protein
MIYTTKIKGSTLIEVLVVAGVLASISLAILGTLSLFSRLHEKDMLSIKGQLLTEEGIEALRFIKALGWSSLSNIPSGQTRYLSLGASSWGVTTVPEIIDGVFWRTIKVYQVMRNASDDIVSSGGTIDPNTLLLESKVSWSWRGATSTTEYQAYITNL